MHPTQATQLTQMTEADLPAFTRGCAVLGTGGGGAVANAVPFLAQALRRFGPVPVARVEDLGDDELVVPLGGIGAPTVAMEMPGNAEQPRLICEEIEQLTGRRIAAVMSAEIGGGNGLGPILWATQLGVPMLDADGMGRAFPEVQMTSMHLAGITLNPTVLADVLGQVSTLRPADAAWAERQARALCVASGGMALIATYLMTAAQARGAVIEGSVSAAVRIGRSVQGPDPLAGLMAELGARCLIEGKVRDVNRTTGGGFVRGSVTIEGTGSCRGRMLRVELQNENLAVIESGEVLATVPDLITMVDPQTASAISTEMLRYGQRVALLAWPCHPLWRSPRALDLVGPRAFGYDLDYHPVEDRPSPAH
ncbi:DUF917 domain-containing protein [Kribbella solani]|uniref:DUF917 family protein n=1 Tax=Kribbella solani TaxID=236067 RepID=A0A841DXT8_9ACTN|nr:DUF917 domain-containing protein [Kribbella solani]MBB5980048.1 DUF917 family protein [Kribbella solani]